MKISKEEFMDYKAVQESGITNMLDIKTVGDLSGLSKEKILVIMKTYGQLVEEYI